MTQEQFDAITAQLSNLAEANLQMQAQLDLLTAFAHILVKAAPSPHVLADLLRGFVREELQSRSDHPDQAYESALTLALAAFLEAAGEPPKR